HSDRWEGWSGREFPPCCVGLRSRSLQPVFSARRQLQPVLWPPDTAPTLAVEASAMADSGEGALLAASGAGVPATLPARRGAGPPSFVGHGFVGRDVAPRFRDRRFAHRRFARFGAPFVFGLGLAYGAYSYYDDPCYAWTPYGYAWVCGYDY